MAGVYIANMELPAVCDECESGFVHTIGCTKRSFFNDRDIARHPECPLHFVPDHVKLIDANAHCKWMESELQKFKALNRFDEGLAAGYEVARREIQERTPAFFHEDKEADHGKV